MRGQETENENSLSEEALAWHPEPDEKLQARFAAALFTVWDPKMIADAEDKQKETDRPLSHREHIFDTLDGYRIGISVEAVRGKHQSLHISMSSRTATVLDRAGIHHRDEISPERLRQTLENVASRIVPPDHVPLSQMELLVLRVSPAVVLHGVYSWGGYSGKHSD